MQRRGSPKIRLIPLTGACALVLAVTGCGGGSGGGSGSNGGNGAEVGFQSSINDTGIDWCADSSTNFETVNHRRENCDIVSSEWPGQDAMRADSRDVIARDGELQKTGEGAAGFDYTKLDEDGEDLNSDADDWTCVRDNQTGLIWEVKTDDGDLRDGGHRYIWHEPDGPNMSEPGEPAGQGDGDCTDIDCDTASYVDAVNDKDLCGADDWRLPTLQELHSLSHLGDETEGIAAATSGDTRLGIDTDFFPNTAKRRYYSSTTDAGDAMRAWTVYFGRNAEDARRNKNFQHGVRLVREGGG